ncbi:hypothetical protein [Pseudomonas sp. F1002]|uniref:hypothetical protein n=1 Tax=Pseudomonas sp. F1002 TaxID=2738821 RepID=UPI00159FDF90|nr:hypothetical protein [Pseudomonas sp. F1002]NWB64204.1 hypothetical protein [Pseudomonas sp. F1002]
MTTNWNDSLSKVLNEIEVDRRLTVWLWINLRLQYPQVNFGELESSGVRDRMAAFITETPWLKINIEQQKNALFLTDASLQWITDDTRQLKWVLQRVSERAGFHSHNLLQNLTGRELVIATIDIWAIELMQKANEIINISNLWNQHKQSDYIFRWFINPEESEKYQLAWELISKKTPFLTAYKEPFNNYQELLIFFDLTNFREAEKTICVDSIKKRWSQNKYREKNTGKKQYNFLLSDKSINILDKLAATHELKRAKILEILIQMESEKGIYIAEKLKILRDL